VLYLTPPSRLAKEAITPGLIGAIATPKQGNRILPEWTWGGDNGCWGSGYPGNAGYGRWLRKMRPLAGNCLFMTAPDVVCDARATLARSAPMLPVIREIGYRPGFVIQNGITPGLVPWDEDPAIFIGGDDAFKTSREARRIVDMARAAGLWVHMGRVNTLTRLLDAARMGCDSADGRTMALFPATIEQMTRWVRDGRVQQGLLWLSCSAS
jgi:hypothetical protein